MDRHDKANRIILHTCLTNAPKMNLKGLGSDVVEWINLAQASSINCMLTNTIMKLHV